MTDSHAASAPEPVSQRRIRSGSIFRFLFGLLLGLMISGFILTAEVLSMSSPPIVLAILGVLDLALLALLARRALQRNASSLQRGVVTGASIAVLLSASCWGMAFTHHF